MKGGGPLEDREKTVYIMAVLVLAAVAVYVAVMAGIIDGPGGFQDGPDLPPPAAVVLEQGDTSQDIPFWRTEFVVSGFRGDMTPFPLGNFSCALFTAGDELEGVTLTLIDLDGDGNVSVGDVIRITHMTDEVNGAVLEVYRDVDTVAREEVSWDVSDPDIYSAFLYWNYPVEANGSRWDTNFSVTHLAIPFEVSPANLSFDVVGEDGGPLEDAVVVFEDWRDEGVLSDFDRVHVLGMTEDYQRARVRMYLDGTLVAIGTVPQWVF